MVKYIILRLGGGAEPTYRMYFSMNVENCQKYWRHVYGDPVGYLGIMAGLCRGSTQIYIHFDCHGDPWEPSTDMSYGDLLPIYWPEAVWAQGKFRIYTKNRSYKPPGVFLPLHDEVDIVNRCCPKDWIDEIVGTEGVPD